MTDTADDSNPETVAPTPHTPRRSWTRAAKLARRHRTTVATATALRAPNGGADGGRIAPRIDDGETQDEPAPSEHNIDTTQDDDDTAATAPAHKRRGRCAPRFSLGVIPLAAMALALAAAYLKFEDATARADSRAGVESVQAAKDSTIAMLSYTPDTAEAKLTAARDRLTGTFRDSYASLTNDLVIPGAKQKQISATATVPAAAPVSATDHHAIVVVFVNQAVTIGNDAPTDTASVVQVTLDKLGNRWLISGFDPK